MADQGNESSEQQGGTETETTDYKSLWEQAKADAEKWKTQARKNESRAKSNAGAAKDLEGVNEQLADLTQRFAAIEQENEQLKASAKRAALVKKVAADTGVPESIVSTLAANDEKALSAAATAIAEAYKQPGGAPGAPEAGKRVATGDGKDNASRFADIFAQHFNM